MNHTWACRTQWPSYSCFNFWIYRLYGCGI